MSDELERFVRHARERGLDLPSIRTLLLSSGWKDKQIAEALSSGQLELPIPQPRGAGSARDVFLHLLAFTALYTWVVSLVLLLFNCIDLALPDPAWELNDYAREARLSGIRASLASIIVSYPAFLALWRYLLREVAAQPERAKSTVRRWLTFLSLFVGAVTLGSDVITLVYYVFEGELTTRFLLKVLTLFVISGSGILYLMLTARAETEHSA